MDLEFNWSVWGQSAPCVPQFIPRKSLVFYLGECTKKFYKWATTIYNNSYAQTKRHGSSSWAIRVVVIIVAFIIFIVALDLLVLGMLWNENSWYISNREKHLDEKTKNSNGAKSALVQDTNVQPSVWEHIILSIPLTIHALIRVLLIFIKIGNVEVRRYLQIWLSSSTN